MSLKEIFSCLFFVMFWESLKGFIAIFHGQERANESCHAKSGLCCCHTKRSLLRASNSRLYPSIRNFNGIVFISSRMFVNFDRNFFHSSEYHLIPWYVIPWKKFRSKLTQIIGQTLFFHFDEMKTILWKFRIDVYNLEFDTWTFLAGTNRAKPYFGMTQTIELSFVHFLGYIL